MLKKKPLEISEIREQAIAFLDNGGGVGDEACDYCQGAKDPSSSDNPEKAIISLKNNRETSYKVYIAVQNELVAAYNDLRDREFVRLNPLLGLTFVEANKRYADPRTTPEEKERLKPKLAEVKLMFPQKLSEAEPSKNN